MVLALGTRLGPFGALPQYGFDYWPREAKIIQVRCGHQDLIIRILELCQVDINARKLGLTQAVDCAVLGDAKLAAAALTEMLRASPPSCLATAQVLSAVDD